MVSIGSTKPRLGDIWPQLAVSACVLLAPPLLMAAGLTYFGSSTPQGTEPAATAAAVEIGEKPVSFAPPDVAPGASFATASTEQRTFVAEPHPLLDVPAAADQTAVLRSAETTTDTSAAAPEHPPDASRKVARNEPHNGHVARRQRTLGDIFPFLRPSGR
jgi:hypothetical protein